VCASLLIASGATDMQVTNQMGHTIPSPLTTWTTVSRGSSAPRTGVVPNPYYDA